MVTLEDGMTVDFGIKSWTVVEEATYEEDAFLWTVDAVGSALF